MNPVFPSILSTNYFNLGEKLREFDRNRIDFIHLDVMDGHFVGNISFGPSAAEAIKSSFKFGIDAHLMVSNPGEMIPKFIQAGSDWISFHIETRDRIKENILTIKNSHLKAGLVLNPDSRIDSLFAYLNDIDYVLLMSVFPGYGGQKFIDSTVEKVYRVKKRIEQEGCGCLIQVDGGINLDNIGDLKSAGCDIFVIGTFLYNSKNIEETLAAVLNKINGA